MLIAITNNTLEPISTVIDGVSHSIKAGNVSETVRVEGGKLPANLARLRDSGFIRVERMFDGETKEGEV